MDQIWRRKKVLVLCNSYFFAAIRLDLLFVYLEELGRFRQSSQQCRYRTQLGRTEIDLDAVTDTIIEDRSDCA